MTSSYVPQSSPIVIVGGGLAGASAFCQLSKFSQVLLIETKENYMEHPYDVSRVVCKHTVQFFPPIITPGDRSVFPIPVNHIQYSSRNESADLLPKEELGRSVGYIMDEAACCTKMLEKGLESEGIVAWNTEVQDAVSVEKESGHSIEIKCINRIDQTE